MLIPLIVVPVLFIGLPWLIFHYMTKWKQAKTLTTGDEKLLDELHDAARRLDDRLCTIERIMTAENPELAPAVPAGPQQQPAPAGGRRASMADDRYPDRYRTGRMTSSRRAARDSTATSATARSTAFAPGSPIIPGSTSSWSASAWSPRCS